MINDKGSDISFLLGFALLSYAAVIFFAIGLGIALSQNRLSLIKLMGIFAVVAAVLSLCYKMEPLSKRLLISLTWTSVLGQGFRFGRKILQKSAIERK